MLRWFSLLGLLEDNDIGVKSEFARPTPGRSPVDCCACTAAAACFINDEVDRDLCSINSDTLRFLRIGFFWRKELDFDRRLVLIGEFKGESEARKGLALPVWRGPYSQVTSQSFSLREVRIMVVFFGC